MQTNFIYWHPIGIHGESMFGHFQRNILNNVHISQIYSDNTNNCLKMGQFWINMSHSANEMIVLPNIYGHEIMSNCSHFYSTDFFPSWRGCVLCRWPWRLSFCLKALVLWKEWPLGKARTEVRIFGNNQYSEFVKICSERCQNFVQ